MFTMSVMGMRERYGVIVFGSVVHLLTRVGRLAVAGDFFVDGLAWG